MFVENFIIGQKVGIMKLSPIGIVKYCYLIIVFIISFFVFQTFAWTWEIQLKVEILGWWLSIWSPANFNFGSITSSPDDQIITGQFGTAFWLEDLNWNDNWYYTTIQCKWLKSAWWDTLTGIYFKKNNLFKILWSDNPRIQLQNVFSDYYLINKPIVYIYRNPAPNYWTISLYWDIPFIKIFIPWYTPTWVYTWTITYTLFVN